MLSDLLFEGNCTQCAIAAAGYWVASSRHGPAVAPTWSFETLISYDSPKMSWLSHQNSSSLNLHGMGDFKSNQFHEIWCTATQLKGWTWYPTTSTAGAFCKACNCRWTCCCSCRLTASCWEWPRRLDGAAGHWEDPMFREDCEDTLRNDRSRKKFKMEQELWWNSQNI